MQGRFWFGFIPRNHFTVHMQICLIPSLADILLLDRHSAFSIDVVLYCTHIKRHKYLTFFESTKTLPPPPCRQNVDIDVSQYHYESYLKENSEEFASISLRSLHCDINGHNKRITVSTLTAHLGLDRYSKSKEVSAQQDYPISSSDNYLTV